MWVNTDNGAKSHIGKLSTYAATGVAQLRSTIFAFRNLGLVFWTVPSVMTTSILRQGRQEVG